MTRKITTVSCKPTKNIQVGEKKIMSADHESFFSKTGLPYQRFTAHRYEKEFEKMIRRGKGLRSYWE